MVPSGVPRPRAGPQRAQFIWKWVPGSLWRHGGRQAQGRAVLGRSHLLWAMQLHAGGESGEMVRMCLRVPSTGRRRREGKSPWQPEKALGKGLNGPQWGVGGEGGSVEGRGQVSSSSISKGGILRLGVSGPDPKLWFPVLGCWGGVETQGQGPLPHFSPIPSVGLSC